MNYINELRWEACSTGVIDPRTKSRHLTEADYVPMQWSQSLELIARIRAAETTTTLEHSRLNGQYIFNVRYGGLTQTEDVAMTGHQWNADYTIDVIATCQNEGSKSIHCSTCDAGKWYYFESSGAMVKKAWAGDYYLDSEGVMVTYAYIQNGAKFYWVNADGKYTKTYTAQDTPGYTIYNQATGKKTQ